MRGRTGLRCGGATLKPGQGWRTLTWPPGGNSFDQPTYVADICMDSVASLMCV
jgi:hypothetical protein